MNFNDILPGLFAFGVALLIGPMIIKWLKTLHAGQSIREEGPKSHLKKGGTPTIGGLIFLFSSTLSLLVFRLLDKTGLLLLFSTMIFALIGFIDDYIKVIKKRNLGLTSKQKLILQIIAGLLVIGLHNYLFEDPTSIYIPIINKYWDMSLFYIPFMLFVVVGTVNSTNLTDGLDGLSSSVTIVVMIFSCLLAQKLGDESTKNFSIVFAGGLLGFLVFNAYPARVFMGDTGSLALGGAVSCICMILKLPLLLPILGAVYFLETLSVIIQVLVFQKTGKRVFIMSPLHHHFEGKGWNEKKVVRYFCMAAIVFGILAYLMVK